MALQSSDLVQIPFTEEERLSGVPTLAHVEEALVALHRDGIVVLNNVIDPKHLDALSDRMVPEALQLAKEDDIHWNVGKDTGNFSQYPPVYKEYLFEDIFANRIAAAILNNYIGPNSELRWLYGNTSLDGKIRQPVHADMTDRFHLNIPFAVTANFYLVDVDEHNGVTEFWPGTHSLGVRGLTKSYELEEPYILESALEERRQIRPPIRPSVAKGSVVLRDLRLWHCGVPNRQTVPRIMFSMIYFARWYQNKMRLKFPESVREIVERFNEHGVQIIADFLPDEGYDHLKLEFNANFNGASSDARRLLEDPNAPATVEY